MLFFDPAFFDPFYFDPGVGPFNAIWAVNSNRTVGMEIFPE